MKNYRSRLARNWIAPELLREVTADNEAGAVGAASDLTPRCCHCSTLLGHKVTVVSVAMEHSGKLGDGRAFTDFRAKCHGEEEVLRIKGMSWDKVRESARDPHANAQDLAAIAALPFFHRSTVQ